MVESKPLNRGHPIRWDESLEQAGESIRPRAAWRQSEEAARRTAPPFAVSLSLGLYQKHVQTPPLHRQNPHSQAHGGLM